MRRGAEKIRLGAKRRNHGEFIRYHPELRHRLVVLAALVEKKEPCRRLYSPAMQKGEAQSITMIVVSIVLAVLAVKWFNKRRERANAAMYCMNTFGEY